MLAPPPSDPEEMNDAPPWIREGIADVAVLGRLPSADAP